MSTDCDEMANNVKERLQNVKIHRRSTYTATDSASSLISVQEFCQKHIGQV